MLTINSLKKIDSWKSGISVVFRTWFKCL